MPKGLQGCVPLVARHFLLLAMELVPMVFGAAVTQVAALEAMAL
jgi:hypothetical protein